MKVTVNNIGKILNVEELCADDNKVTLTVEILQAIENALDKQAKEIASLNERISVMWSPSLNLTRLSLLCSALVLPKVTVI